MIGRQLVNSKQTVYIEIEEKEQTFQASLFYLNVDRDEEIKMSSLDVSPLGSADITSKHSFPSSLPVNDELEVKLSFKPSFSDNKDKYILKKIKVKLSQGEVRVKGTEES